MNPYVINICLIYESRFGFWKYGIKTYFDVTYLVGCTLATISPIGILSLYKPTVYVYVCN